MSQVEISGREQALTYNESTQTLRLMPANLMVASNEKGYWVCDPDALIPKDVSARVFSTIISDSSIRFSAPGKLIETLNQKVFNQ